MNAVSAPEHAALARLDVERWHGAQHTAASDAVADEVPIALEYNGIGHVVMLASPTDLEDFALGFSLTEGIVAAVGEVYDVEVAPGTAGIAVRLTIAAARCAGLKERRRNLAGRTGCGLCGAESLDQVFRPLAPVTSPLRLRVATLHEALARSGQRQRLQRLTGATHAAFWLRADGEIDCVREDVGRHNALDKLIGALAAQHCDFGAGAALITSRASYEMVQKAAAVGIGLVAAVSAPTALAVRMAESLNLTLVGFARAADHVVYAHPERLIA
ncbi:MAG: formate dehydrogenase accessory sulfurtransferase FdhD [Rhodocyclales bacterium]|nr:formate dehydrogenase accessory sulfurtransferase FdhD [Rhodocyclales bacterium]